MLSRFDSAADFLTRLDTDDERLLPLLRIVEPLLHRPRPNAYLALALDGESVDGESVVGAAAWTPPWPLTVARWPLADVPELVADATAHAPLGSFVGPEAVAEAVIAAHRPPTRRSEMIFHVLTELTPPAPGPGARRLAGDDDVPLLAEWLPRFLADVKLPQYGDPLETARGFVRDRRMHLWIEDGRPVAATAHLDFTHDNTHVGMVYVPPELRGAGRASRLVGSVTRDALERGRRRLTLYTDADNPISNHIYERLGYVARFRHLELGFED